MLTVGARGHNLPLQGLTLLGREADLAVLGARLLRPDIRLVTLSGLGGTGKMRLAVAAVRGSAGDFRR